MKFISDTGIQVHYYQNESFPRRLLHCPDHPIVLYSKGTVNMNADKVLSIVGTRRATPYGKEITNQIVTSFKDYNIIICSGLAFGIDAQAHQSAVQNNIQTIGTVAHGLDKVYPKEHTRLAKEMEENGGLLTEFTSGTIPNRENFPRRNRIVAGMSDATLVVESKSKGGALITAYQASGYNRDVFAIPGKANDTFSEGCNLLIQKNVAGLVLSAEDIIKAMGWEMEPNKKTTQMELLIDLTEDELKIKSALAEQGALKRDEIAALIGSSSSNLATCLLQLELKGVIKSLPGNVYKL